MYIYGTMLDLKLKSSNAFLHIQMNRTLSSFVLNYSKHFL